MVSIVHEYANPASLKTRVVVLLSGGIDSAATLAVFHRRKSVINAVFVDYGQASRKSEWEAAQAVADHYNTPISKLRLGFKPKYANGEIFCRNALFAMAAGSIVDDRPLIIAMGIHQGTPFYDTTQAFVDDLQRLLDGYAGGAIALGMPFLELKKPDIVKFSRRHRVPMQLTYSCEWRSAPPCGTCPSCMDRIVLNVE